MRNTKRGGGNFYTKEGSNYNTKYDGSKKDIFSEALKSSETSYKDNTKGNERGYNNKNQGNNYESGNQGYYTGSNYNQPEQNTIPEGNDSNYSRMKQNEFAKDTHKNQKYKKREYNRKEYLEQKATEGEKPEKIIRHNIDPEYNTEYRRIQEKLLDIEIRQEDEENKQKIDEVKELIRSNVNKNYKDIVKTIDDSIAQTRENRDKNIFLQIISNNETLCNSPELVSSIVDIIGSTKSDDEIQQDLIDFLGYDELDLISELLQNRKQIKELIDVVKTYIEENERNERNRENLSMYGKSNPNSSITIEVMDNKSKKKKIESIQKTQMTNLRILQQLGFDNKYIRENQLLGLSEKKMNQAPTLYIEKFGIDPNLTLRGKSANHYMTSKKQLLNHVEIKVKPLVGERKPVTLVKTDDLPAWAQRCFNFSEFNQIQSTVFQKANKTDENLLICAPTGAGKTNIALLTILREIQKQLNSLKFDSSTMSSFSNINWNFKIVYLVPLKALANEIVDKFKSTLSFLNIKVNEFSADVNLSKEQIEQTNLFVAIPEKWDLFTRKNDGIYSSLKLIIIDEVHLLNEDRGRILECIVARTIRKIELNQRFIRIVGLSATLPNYWDIAEFLKVKDGLFNFDSSYRATPLKMKFLGVGERRSEQEYKDFENQIVFEEIVKYIDKSKQVLVFVHSRNETMNFAKEIIRLASLNYRTDILKQGNSKSNKFIKFTNKTLDELVPYGIGFHNAGLMRKDRNTVESLFANKTINLLVSTSTLAWGVNLPAYAVIIKGVTFYDASKGCLTDMGILDIQQMFGRAGRPQFDTKGVAMIVSPFKKVDYFVNLLRNQIDIESKLPKFLSDALNAEVAIGNILNIEDAISWLKLTYLSIRLKDKKNNNYDMLNALANEALDKLNKFKLIRYVKNTGAIHSTELGRIACKYYMSYQSIANFAENLKEDMHDDELLHLFSKSEEFSSMRIYPEEKKELEQLAEQFDIVSQKSLMKDINVIPKPMILLQTYLKGFYEFKSSSLHMDCSYIIDNSSRIMRAVLEIALHKHLVRTTFLCLNYVKLVERRVYPGCTPLWQFTYESNKKKDSRSHDSTEAYLSPDVCRKIDEANLNVNDILTEDKNILSKILKMSIPRVIDTINFAKILPSFRLDVIAKPITRTILNITINLTPLFKWKKRWNHLHEPLWILVDDKKEIIHYEYFILPAKKSEKFSKNDKEKETIITFAVPFQIEAGEKEAAVDKIYTITVASDKWVGVEYTHHIFLNEIEVPQDQDVHTELLDLYPLPVTALNNPDYEKIFSFTHFNPVQTQVFYSCYQTDENILVGAPTGSGKTAVAELAMLRAFKIKPQSKIIYIAPLKSLAKERLRDWETKLKFLNKKVIELTGDYTPDLKQLLEADLLITTPEKWDGISRNWHHRTYVQRVSLVVIDEIHLLGLDRGPVLEVIVSRMRYIADKTKSGIRFVGLSTALANSYDVATWLGISTKNDNKKPPGLFNFKPAVRPCPVTVHIEGFAEKHYCPRMGTMNKPAYNAIREFSPLKPVLVFVSSRRQTRLTALDLISLCANESSQSFLKIPVDEMGHIIELVKDDNLKHTLSFGIGMHHAGLVESDRRIVEDLFCNMSIQVLIATSTLAWGVNFPAHLVVVKGTEYYDPKLKSYVDMPITDVLQMIGRAGRPQYDDSAVACLFVTQDKKNFYKKFLYEPFPLESALHKMLYEHINAEVASGTLLSKQSCIEYITWTYFFRRLLKNPSYYGLKSVDAKTLNEYLTKLIEDVLKNLSDSKCITLHSDNSLSSTLLGYLTSFYYISYKTAYGFEMMLKPGLLINSLIEILSDAEEFSQLPVRHNEEELNEALSKLCPLEVDTTQFESPHIKTNLLLQAHLSRLEMPISDYVTDTKLVLDNCFRILLFMIDISAEKGYLDTTINLIVLSQTIMQGVWLNESSLLSLPYLTQEDVAKLNSEVKINHLPELIEKKYQLDDIFNRCKIKLNSSQLKEIKNVLNKIPEINMDYNCHALNPDTLERIYDSTIKSKCDTQISVRLEKLNKNYDNTVCHSKYSKIKTCRWFLIIGNIKTNELLGMKKVSFREITKKDIDFVASYDIDDSSLQLYLMSDSYVGIDQQQPVLLKSINKRIIKKFNLKEENQISISNASNTSGYIYDSQLLDVNLCKAKEEDAINQVNHNESESDSDPYRDDDEIIFDNW